MKINLSRLSRLPSLPTVAVELLQVFADPDVSIRDVVDTIKKDPAITGKLLRAANSSQFGVGREITDLHRAVMLLGKKHVSSLALSFSLAEASMSSGTSESHFKAYWLQSAAQATAAEILSETVTSVQPGECFTVSLLASIGRLAFLKGNSKLYAECLQRAEAEQRSLIDVEKECFDATAADVSATLLTQWNLPQRFVDAVRLQNAPIEELRQAVSEEDGLPAVVAVAVAIGEYVAHSHKGIALARVNELMDEFFGLTITEIETYLEQVHERIESTAELFDTDLSDLGSPMELLAEAMEQLSTIVAVEPDAETVPAIRNELMEENGRLKRRVAELTRRSLIDPLTSVFNRGHFAERLAQEGAISRVQGQSLGLLFIDIDHFKQINDTYGHLAGDEVLRRVARSLESTTRGSDFLARYGGEEFVIMMSRADHKSVSFVGERLRESVESEVITFEGNDLSVSVSVGAAFGVPPRDDQDFEERLISVADSAMYSAKKGGRNRVVVTEVDANVPTVNS